MMEISSVQKPLRSVVLLTVPRMFLCKSFAEHLHRWKICRFCCPFSRAGTRRALRAPASKMLPPNARISSPSSSPSPPSSWSFIPRRPERATPAEQRVGSAPKGRFRFHRFDCQVQYKYLLCGVNGQPRDWEVRDTGAMGAWSETGRGWRHERCGGFRERQMKALLNS